ncbi:hypothetical protein PMAYCL1PPCAC_15911, partial [Pristionchus mayeri]
FMRLLLYLSLFPAAYSLKFLAFSTQFARAHANYIARLSDVLVEAGHEVIPQCKQARVFDDFLDRVSANIWVMRHSVQMMQERRRVNAIWGHACLSVLDSPGLLDSLKLEHFDAAFSESADVCGPVLFHLLGINKWAVTDSVAIQNNFDITQTPSNPAYVPGMMANAGEQMSFVERLGNTLVATQFMIGTVYSDIEGVLRERLPDLPPVPEILASNSLVFLNSEPLVDFPRPS